MKRTSPKSASSIPDGIKTNLARLYIIQHEKGKPRAEFVKELSDSGLHVSTRQLDRWVARVNESQEAISTMKLSGGIASLERPQRDIASGWVLEQIELGKAVHLEGFCEFVLVHFNVKIVDMTASNYLKEDGFTYRVLQKKSASFVVDVSQLRCDLWNWVSTHQNYLNKIPRSKLASIDFTFTGHRTERASGFGIKGGAQPMQAAPISKFTNCIVTCVWADGINRTPPILYTLNPNFRRDRNLTARRSQLVEHLDECLARHGIDEDRVVYIGKPVGEKEQYAKESPELLRLFFERYGVDDEATVLSDNGNSFFTNGDSVLESIGFKKHLFYAASVHQFLSPNDNRLHGTSKQSWRSPVNDHSDDVNSSLTLLKYLDRDIINHSRFWFDRNILRLKESEVEEVVASAGSKKSHLHKAWLRAYRISCGKDARGERKNVPEELRDHLDGNYWEIQNKP